MAAAPNSSFGSARWHAWQHSRPGGFVAQQYGQGRGAADPIGVEGSGRSSDLKFPFWTGGGMPWEPSDRRSGLGPKLPATCWGRPFAGLGQGSKVLRPGEMAVRPEGQASQHDPRADTGCGTRRADPHRRRGGRCRLRRLPNREGAMHPISLEPSSRAVVRPLEPVPDSDRMPGSHRSELPVRRPRSFRRAS